MLKCLLSEVFNCQSVKDVEVFLQALCVLFVRGFYGLDMESFFIYSLFARGFCIKRFLQVLCFSFCGFTVCVREFLQVL